MSEEILSQAEGRMAKSIEAVQNELSQVRAGRAHPSLLDHIEVDYYGASTPLNQVASVNAVDARMLSVVPWEKSMLSAVEKAIMVSPLGLNPQTDGVAIRVPLPPLTEERRKDLVKRVHQISENAKVSVRSARRDANKMIQKNNTEKLISDDEKRSCEAKVQVMTDETIKKIDALIAVKENDLMQV